MQNGNSRVTSLSFKADSDNPSVEFSKFVVSPEIIKADGVQTSTLKLTLVDGNKNPILEDGSDYVIFSSPLVDTNITKTNIENGVYTGRISGTKAGDAIISVSVGNKPFAITPKVVKLLPSTPAQAYSSIKIDKTSYKAGEEIKVTVTLKDANENNVDKQETTLSSSNAVTVKNAIEKAGSNWVYTTDGQYTRTYLAQTAGINLNASLAWSEWTKRSQNYDITAGKAVAANSTIIVDNSTYTSGSDIDVSVTLQDSQSNGINDIATARNYLNAVTVANASEKNGTDWSYTANSQGEYTRTYKVDKTGTHLKAGLGLLNILSEEYAITAGDAVADKSALEVDKTSYVAGNDIKVSVTLQDNAGNGINNITTAQTYLNAVKVPNADEQGQWTYTANSQGGYTRTYKAIVAETGLKSTLNINTLTLASSRYDITASDAVADKSEIKVDKASYIAGNNIQVTVTLQDSESNGINDLATAQTYLNAVTVPNSEGQGKWTYTPSSKGEYTRTYLAGKIGKQLKAELTALKIMSPEYAITAGEPTTDHSGIKVDKVSYVSGSDIQVTVTLQDSASNGINDLTTAQTYLNGVTVQNADGQGNWTNTPNSQGEYTRTYLAGKSGTQLKAEQGSLKIASAQYTITAGKPTTDHSGVKVDKASYVAGSNINVTVTLQDSASNGINDLTTAQTYLDAVIVPNADGKGVWTYTPNSQGEYTRSFLADKAAKHLKAELNPLKVTSEEYEIIEGDAVTDKSRVEVDKTLYISGSDIQVSVTLQDNMGNGINNIVAAKAYLDTIVVANASVKNGTGWNYIKGSQGEYSQTYKAGKPGIGLKAELSALKIMSAEYAINAGEPATDKSGITVDKVSYVSGSDIQVTVTLQDGESNGINDLATAQTYLDTVTVPNADVKGDWTYTLNSEGEYTRTYLAGKAGTQLKAELSSLKISSAQYAITADKPTTDHSGIKVDKASYVSGNDIQVTVTLQDSASNGINDLATAQTYLNEVMVPNADGQGKWTYTSNSQGEYTRTYHAGKIGQQLKAELTALKIMSSEYAITTGEPTTDHSGVKVDKASYVAGSDINVTVTLQDSVGNGINDLTTAQTYLDAVTVPNADEQGKWTYTPSSEGEYTRTYQAGKVGTQLKAGLGLLNITSAEYAITEGKPVTDKSEVKVDKASYISGSDIQVTVTLQDSASNGINDLATAQTYLNEVMVPNADGQGEWTYTSNSQGEYTRTYHAGKIGQQLKAELTALKIMSSEYAITTGEPTTDHSGIKVDKASYVAGSDIKVTVTLQDSASNGINTLEAAQTYLDAVTVPNTDGQGKWTYTPSSEGEYTRTYLAGKAGTQLKAELSSLKIASAQYAITADKPTTDHSGVKVDKASYVSGGDINVTVTLQDSLSNGINDLATAQTYLDTVTVPNADVKGDWTYTPNSQGEYTRVYQAITSGTHLKAELSSLNIASEEYSIIPGDAVADKSKINVDNSVYILGRDIKVSVTLQDSMGNGINDQTVADAYLKTVAIPNADGKDAWQYTKDSKGEYTRTYTAKSESAKGGFLNATLSLTKDKSITSQNYYITDLYFKKLDFVYFDKDANSGNGGLVAVGSTALYTKTDITVTASFKDNHENDLLPPDGYPIDWSIKKNMDISVDTPTYTKNGVAVTQMKGDKLVLESDGVSLTSSTKNDSLSAPLAFFGEATITPVNSSVYTEQQVGEQLKVNRAILIKSSDWLWFIQIHLPTGDEYKNKVVAISMGSSWATRLYLGDKESNYYVVTIYIIIKRLTALTGS
ncbi:Ig-like domain-containing protein [Proteus myxofaciens]|nr:Ig-like domain-containing protein [Proteus myxofaciens]